MSNTNFTFLDGPATEAAPRLLSCQLIRHIGEQEIIVEIVETEAYTQEDLASHSYRGPTASNEVMFGQPGRLYVYFTYGMHYCCNVVVGQEGYGAAVLIRGVAIIQGEEYIKPRRHNLNGYALTNGPAKLCQALDIDKRLNGHDLKTPPLELLIKDQLSQSQIKTSKRIGISKARDFEWRYFLKDSPFVSKP
jgi:DNA-3-methyladenine glycosylase